MGIALSYSFCLYDFNLFICSLIGSYQPITGYLLPSGPITVSSRRASASRLDGAVSFTVYFLFLFASRGVPSLLHYGFFHDHLSYHFSPSRKVKSIVDDSKVGELMSTNTSTPC